MLACLFRQLSQNSASVEDIEIGKTGCAWFIFEFENLFTISKPRTKLSLFPCCFSDECQFTQVVGTLLPVNIPVCPPGSQKTEVEPQHVPIHTIPPTVTPAERPNPEPVPLVMPAVNESKPSDTYAQLDLDGEFLGDDLDELLDKAAPADLPMVNV